MALLEARCPAAARVVGAVARPESRIVWRDDEAVDIDIGGTRLYAGGVAAFVSAQIADYFKDPERVIFNVPEGVYHSSPVSVRMMEFMVETLQRHGIGQIVAQPKDVVGFLIVIGVGLGAHIAPLLARTGARHLILVEPIAEFLHHSLSAIDWGALFARCDAEGVTVDVVVEARPDAAVGRINALVRDYGVPFLDGSYLFTHYATFVTTEIRSRFKAGAMMLITTRGFFEDEVLMFTNAAANLGGRPFLLVDGEPRPKRREPAFVVASGPSLDDSLETIRRWKDHAVVFSSGSSLQPLLANGVVPDYHVELENVPHVVDLLHHILDRHRDHFPAGRFAGVRLIASATVDPAVPALFDVAYLFFRDSVVSTATLGGGARIIFLAGPNVSNTSLTLAAILGFHEIYLFGTDCGMKGERHHARDTVYYTSERFQGVSSGPRQRQMTYPGNFGGVVDTDFVLDWNRQFLEETIQLYGLRVYNCSDGVLIEGTTPKVPEGVAFSHPPLDKPRLIAEIRAASRNFRPREYLQGRDLAALVGECDRLGRDLADLFAAARREDRTFEQFFARLAPFLGRAGDDYGGVRRMIGSSLLGLASIAAFYLHRIEDGEARERVLEDFIDEYAGAVAAMIAKARELCTGLVRTAAEGG